MDWCRTAGRVAPCGQTVTLLGWPFFLEYSEEEAHTSKMMRETFHATNVVSGCFGEFPSFFFNSYQYNLMSIRADDLKRTKKCGQKSFKSSV